jgi:hypothetical protein
MESEGMTIEEFTKLLELVEEKAGFYNQDYSDHPCVICGKEGNCNGECKE